MIDRAPLVYIIMPCYNGEKYLLEQLMSIYYQNYVNWYLIFVNDGSTDASENIVRDWTSHYNLHEKVKVITKENGGVNTATQRGLEEVELMCNINNTDNLVSYCDADDIRTREKLETQVKYMINHPKCDCSYCDISVIDGNGVLKEKSVINKYYPNRQRDIFYAGILGFCAASTVLMYRVKFIKNILPMPSNMPPKSQAQDKWTNIVLLMLDCNVEFIDKTLVYYRSGHSSLQYNLKYMDKIERGKNHLKFFYEGQKINEKKDISQLIKFNEDVLINWKIKKYPQVIINFLILYKYPNIFFLLLKGKIRNMFGFLRKG